MNQIVSPGIILSVADCSLAERGRNRGEDTDGRTADRPVHPRPPVLGKPRCIGTHGYAVAEADTDDRTLAGDVAGV